MAVFSEAELILPSLYMLDLSGGFIKTSDLIVNLTQRLNPTGKDATLIAGRNDTHFSQKVRNLVSHRTLDTLGLADYIPAQSGLQITAKGKSHLLANQLTIDYLMENNFSWGDVKPALVALSNPKTNIDIFKEIFEGDTGATKETKIYKRSKELRDAAIETFLKDYGSLSCNICTFNYEEKYGNAGKGFIEVHHKTPIYMYEGGDQVKTIEQAIKNLAPVCANCHRIIHRTRPPFTIEEVSEIYQKILTKTP